MKGNDEVERNGFQNVRSHKWKGGMEEDEDSEIWKRLKSDLAANSRMSSFHEQSFWKIQKRNGEVNRRGFQDGEFT